MCTKEWLIIRLKKAGENIESTLSQIFFLALFGGSLAILALSKKALYFVLQLANTATPLWATIALILLCGLYMYLKGNRYFQRKVPYHTSEDLITVGLFKWKVLHAKGHVLKIDGLPYCPEHECVFIPRDTNWVCPIDGCKSILSQYDLEKVKVAASSIIENLISSSPLDKAVP